jgi:hypothetical protein
MKDVDRDRPYSLPPEDQARTLLDTCGLPPTPPGDTPDPTRRTVCLDHLRRALLNPN